MRKGWNLFKRPFTAPLEPGKFSVLPHRPVPDHIQKPYYYASKGKTDYSSAFDGEPQIHNEETIKSLRAAGRIAAGALQAALQTVKPGVSPEEIDGVVHEYIIGQGAYPTPIYFMGFPKSVCISVNEVLCHGIPDTRVLQEGDYLNIDVTCYFEGVHGDTSEMALVGTTHSPDILKLLETTRAAVKEAISICKPGVLFNEIGKKCQEIAEAAELGVCEEFTGHGVGENLHMPPPVIHVVNDVVAEMKPGMVFTIEPIFTLNRNYELRIWPDGWTVVDALCGASAQCEHTILITETGSEILTLC